MTPQQQVSDHTPQIEPKPASTALSQRSPQPPRSPANSKRKARAPTAVQQPKAKQQKRQSAPQTAAAAAAAAQAAAASGEVQPECQAGVATAATASGAVAAKDDDVKRLLRSWAWKREHRPDKDRFQRPYIHTMSVADSSSSQPAQQVSLTIKQQKFSSEGFASTVWDSSIVVAKYLEKLGQAGLKGTRCLDLSAGCGLAGVVMAKLGATVTVTDLAPNLPLLRHNCNTNGVPATVLEHRWGEDVSGLSPPFEFIVACDVMYVQELVQPLLESLLALSSSTTTVLVAHGRNRPAEPDFKAAAAAHFTVELVPGSELDEVYQCSDVDVLRLRRLPA